MVTRTNQKHLVSKIPAQWQRLFILLSRDASHRKLAHAWYRTSQHKTKSLWDDLMKALCLLEPVLVQGCLQFQPLLMCLQENVMEGFIDFLLHHQDGVSAESLEMFINTLAQYVHSSHSAFALVQKLAETLSQRGVQLSLKNTTLNNHRLVEGSTMQTDVGSEVLDPSSEKCVGSVKQQNLKVNMGTIDSESSQHSERKTSVHVDVRVCEEQPGCRETSGNVVTQSNSMDESVICIDDNEPEKQTSDPKECSSQRPDALENEHQQEGSASNSSALDSLQSQLQKVKEAWVAGEKEPSADLDILTSLPPSQMGTACEMLGLTALEEKSLMTVAGHLAAIADRMCSSSSLSLLQNIVEHRFADLNLTPSRQFTACLTSLGASFPQQLVTVICNCLGQHPCTAGQAETLVAVCKTLDMKILTYFLGELCQTGVPMDDSMVSVVQCMVDLRPELSPMVITSTLAWLETSAVQQAGSAKYGRLVLSFIKTYRAQFDSSHTAAVRVIVDAHKSFTRRSLQQTIKNLL